MRALSDKSQGLKQSGIRAASVRCAQSGGINLGQGVCDLPIAEHIKQGAYEAIAKNKSMYSACEGAANLRHQLSEKLKTFNKLEINPERELMISHGSTGAFVCAINTLLNPGDNVVLFEPFYGYHKNILDLHGMSVTTTPINVQDFSLDFDSLERAIIPGTKAIVVCTPNNPTGKVYSEQELRTIGQLAEKHDLWIITDEIYEYITYPGHQHVSMASLDDFQQRTVTISGFSKTYNMTGWRLGYASGPEYVMEKMALIQDLLYVCPATPLQHGVIAALETPDDFYKIMSQEYLAKRDNVVGTLRALGFTLAEPQGAYYLLADYANFDWPNAQAAVDEIFQQANVATVAGTAFYADPADGEHLIRICYALCEEKIGKALGQLQANFAAVTP